ncbi:hypothetical protein Tco_0269384 [Tanacetum coccineum]
MTPSTRQTLGSNNGEELVTKQYVDDAMAEIIQTLATMNNTITTLSIQTTQVVNYGTRRQANQSGRLAKWEFPKFQRDDVRGWHYCGIDNVLRPWVKMCIKRQSFKDLVQFEDPMADLKNAKYYKTAKEYQDLFDTLLCRVDVSEDHALSLHLGGLPTELEMSVRMFKPKTLSDEYCLTNLQEATLEAIKKKNNPLGSQLVGGFGMRSDSGSSNKPPLLPFPSANSSLKPNPATALKSPIRKQLTQKEYEEKRAKNLCFYYDKKFVPGHKCESIAYERIGGEI